MCYEIGQLRVLLTGFAFCDRIETVFERFTLVWPPDAADR